MARVPAQRAAPAGRAGLPRAPIVDGGVLDLPDQLGRQVDVELLLAGPGLDHDGMLAI